jgi:hypothetical protein
MITSLLTGVPMPPFSLAALTALELPPPQLVEVAAACGFEQVGLWLLAATPLDVLSAHV